MECPGAPMKKMSPELQKTMNRWKARKCVRELYPELTPKDPQYFTEVHNSMKS
mgnify:CR=1 FL=1